MTHKWQTNDLNINANMKRWIDDEIVRRVTEKMAQGYAELTASQLRVIVQNSTAAAWRKLAGPQGKATIQSGWIPTGCLAPARKDKQLDEQVKPQGMPKYVFPRPPADKRATAATQEEVCMYFCG